MKVYSYHVRLMCVCNFYSIFSLYFNFQCGSGFSIGFLYGFRINFTLFLGRMSYCQRTSVLLCRSDNGIVIFSVISLRFNYKVCECVIEMKRLWLQFISFLLKRVPSLSELITTKYATLFYTKELLIIVFRLAILRNLIILTIILEKLIVCQSKKTSAILNWSSWH